MRINRYDWSTADSQTRVRLLRRSQTNIQDLIETIRPVVDRVRTEGDEALRHFTRQFDGVDLGTLPIQVQPEEFDAAERKINSNVKDALEYAIENVEVFHRGQKPHHSQMVEVRPGLWAGERPHPIDSAGLYVPRGRGSFPSMLYMLAVPAKIAGVPALSVVTPPNEDGSVDPAVLFASRRCGVDRVYRIGGAQAVAALAYGTTSVDKAVKIVGPGSAYVAAAKRIVADHVDVGLPAGPSESIILADRHADPHTVALDLCIEAEHGGDSSALLISSDETLLETVAALLPAIIERAPEPRKTFLTDVFKGYGGLVKTESLMEAIRLVNDFAPEHLLLHTEEPYATLSAIRNAGEILLGPHSAFSLANYAAGANAVLPTGGWARTFSPVSVRDFVAYSSVVHVTKQAYDQMAPHVIALADYEGFHTHAAALRERSVDGASADHPAPPDSES